MKNSINLNLVVLLAFLISSCSSSEINNDKNAYTDKNTYNGEVIELAKQLYRKDAATNADILWVGYKRVAKDKKKNVHWFEPKFLPIYENEIAVRKVTEAYTKESQSAVLEAAAKAGTNVANLNLGLEIEGGKASNKEAGSSGNFHIFKLFEVFKLVDELNRDSNRNERERIARNRNPRIVSSIAIAFNQEESAKIGKSSGINLSSSFGKSAKAEVFIRSNEGSEILAKISDGTVFAYQISRFCWEKIDGNLSIADIEVDRPGKDKDCPDGTEANPLNLKDDHNSSQ